MLLLWEIFVRLITVAIVFCCDKLHITSGSADAAAQWLAVLLVACLGYLMEKKCPSFWVFLKDKFGGKTVPSLFVGGVILIGATAGTIAGCAQTEKNRVAQTYNTIDGTANSVRTLALTRQITLDQAQSLLRTIEAARDATDAWDRARVSSSPDLARLAAVADAALLKLSTEWAAIRAVTTRPATRPVTATAATTRP